jgi:starch-binding outer membrane protein, SusD/RagB family
MRPNIYIVLLIAVFVGGCKKTDDFLTKYPLDKMTDQTYWTSESNVRTFAWGFYTNYFPGYASGFDLSWGGYFSGEALNDDFAPYVPPAFTQNIPASAPLSWTFKWVRSANIFIDRVQKVPMSDEAIRHWTGVGRFFRGLEFYNKVKSYGDFPWYGKEIAETDIETLYKPRDPRTLVMDSVLLDFKYAAENVRELDGTAETKRLIVNKWVVLAFMSRVFLFEGTWQKYQAKNTAKANEYLEAAKWAANEVITKGGFSLAPDYRKLFNSLDLTNNSEIILFRRYESGVGGVTHSLASYVNRESQTGASKNAIEAYLCKDGLPVTLSPLYKGDKTITNTMTDRDPRMYATFVNVLRLNGIANNYSSSGYAVHKFLNDEIKETGEGLSSNNPTDAPVIRLGEVMMNYAEAAAELGTLTQDDLNLSINKLRKRAGIGMPSLEVQGGLPAVNGKVYDDPKRDPGVLPMIWEIRRERRIELMMEGFRTTDLRRWKKYEYVDTKAKPDINRGAWIKKSDFPATKATIEGNAAEGYIIPAPKPESQRKFENDIDDKVYLTPLPQDQIKLYLDNGVKLIQNPGWQ